MSTLPPNIRALADALRQLPQIGPRQALRLALILYRDPSMRSAISDALSNVGTDTLTCERCFRITDTNPCNLCTDRKRDASRLLVVEEDTDLGQIESTGAYHGQYFVLGGRFHTKRGPAEDQGIRLHDLRTRLKADHDSLEEIIIAINPTFEGEALIVEVANIAREFNIGTSRLGRGLPTGGELEYADEETIKAALDSRK